MVFNNETALDNWTCRQNFMVNSLTFTLSHVLNVQNVREKPQSTLQMAKLKR